MYENLATKPIIFQEEWLPVSEEAYPYISPIYHVSSFGRVHSAINNKIMVLNIDNHGYVKVNLNFRPGSGYSHDHYSEYVHRLVLTTFKPVKNWKELQINHINSIRTDNTLWNLEWCTKEENMYHNSHFGYMVQTNVSDIYDIPETHRSSARYTEKDICDMAFLIKTQNYTLEQIGAMYGTTSTYISMIARGVKWSYLGIKIPKE